MICYYTSYILALFLSYFSIFFLNHQPGPTPSIHPSTQLPPAGPKAQSSHYRSTSLEANRLETKPGQPESELSSPASAGLKHIRAACPMMIDDPTPEPRVTQHSPSETNPHLSVRLYQLRLEQLPSSLRGLRFIYSLTCTKVLAPFQCLPFLDEPPIPIR